jgi:glycosyltransferase involved in cell wall biosynthesis
MPRDGTIYEEFRKEGIPVYLVRRMEYIEKDIYQISWFALRKRISLIHASSVEGWVGIRTASLLRRPCIWHIHEMLDSYVTDKAKYLPLADRIVAVSNACAKALSEFTPLDKVEVIHNGVEVERFSRGDAEKILREFEVPEGAPVILAVGSVFPAKGHLYLLQAAQKILSEFPGAKFLFVGDLSSRFAQYHRELRAFVQDAGIEDSVSFTGFRGDVIDFLAAATLVASPSLAESLPLNLIEAMASGKPVVACEVGGVAEVVVDGVTGLLVPPTDSDALASAIIDVLGSPQKALFLGRNGFERASRLFDAKLMAKKFAGLYESLLGFESTQSGPRYA